MAFMESVSNSPRVTDVLNMPGADAAAPSRPLAPLPRQPRAAPAGTLTIMAVQALGTEYLACAFGALAANCSSLLQHRSQTHSTPAGHARGSQPCSR